MASRMQLGPAPVPTPEIDVLTCLHPLERAYVNTLKRKQRSDLVRVLVPRRAPRLEAPLRIEVLQSQLPEELRRHIFARLATNTCDKYLAWVRRMIRLPLQVVHPGARVPGDVLATLQAARERLETHITGHAAPKREVLKLVCQTAHAGSCASNYSLGLEGPPGTGKTHFVRTAVAAALGRPLISIPMGGVNDVSYLLGHLYAYEGSGEGRLASALLDAECMNPIIHFDEVDKIAHTERGAEVTAALIHLTDPSANTALRDRYLHGVDLDFSRCTFILTYNDPSAVCPVLLDRIKRVQMPAPTEEERRAILVRHAIPRILRRHAAGFDFSEAAIDALLRRSTAGGGMRGIERDADHVVANAQLCRASGASEGTPAGCPGTGVFTPDGRLSARFVEAILAAQGVQRDPTPASMYT